MLRKLFRVLSLLVALFMVLTACAGAGTDTTVTAPNPDLAAGEIGIKAEVWSDNWFAFYLDKQLIREDSVPITTERSFNAEVFTFAAAYPLTLNFVVKDFKENDTGLEYIGNSNQQMGDGGFIAQFTKFDTGELIAATDAKWVCLVTHKAPLDNACEQSADPVAGQPPCEFRTVDEPLNWQTLNFDASTWQPATIYNAAQVGAKEGYDEIEWNPAAHLIWSDDLEKDNTLLCRLTIMAPN